MLRRIGVALQEERVLIVQLLKASPIDLEIETIRVIPVLDIFPVGTVIIDMGDEYWIGGIEGMGRIAIFR